MKRAFSHLQTRTGAPKSELLDERRELTLELKEGAIDEANRTANLTFATQAPYERWFGMEILSCDPKHIRMGRLNNGGALLKDHNRNQQTGVVVRNTAKAESLVATCQVKFSKNELGEEEFTDVKDGIRTLVSVGYIVHKMVLESTADGIETYRVIDWEPYEVSIVSIPADPDCGIGKIDGKILNTKQERISMLRSLFPYLLRDSGGPGTKGTGEGGGGTATHANNPDKESWLKAERERISHIEGVVEKQKERYPAIVALGKKAKDSDMTVDAFNAEVLTKIFNAEPITTPSGEIGMTQKEVKRFSLMAACRMMATKEGLTGFEAEVCEAARKHMRRDIKGNAFVVPEDVSRASWEEIALRQLQLRAPQNVTTFGQGGALVQNQYGPMIEFLRNRTVLGKLGVTLLGGIVGDLVLPVQTGGATAYWVSEQGTLSDTLATFGQKVMTPKRLGATIPYTTQFLSQVSLSAEDYLRNELMTVMALKKDLAGLHGTGADGQPLGIANTTGINATVTFGGAATWEDVVEFETGIAADNADIGTMGFALSAATVGKWKTILKSSVAGATYLLEGAAGSLSANGYSAERTNQIAGNIAFFGVWSQLIMAGWAGLEVIVDPFALKKSGQIEITMNELTDNLVRQPLAFNVSTDSAAQ